MSKSVVKISIFEIDDAELSSAQCKEENTLSIPCQSDPDLSMQLDGWNAQISIPALLDGKHTMLYKKNYDRVQDTWIMRFR